MIPSTTRQGRSLVTDFGGRAGPLGAISAGGSAKVMAEVLGAAAGAEGRGANKSHCRYVVIMANVLELKR